MQSDGIWHLLFLQILFKIQVKDYEKCENSVSFVSWFACHRHQFELEWSKSTGIYHKNKTHLPASLRPFFPSYLLLPFLEYNIEGMKLHFTNEDSQAGGVTQAVECLLCKYKALSSNPSPTKKQRSGTLLGILETLLGQCLCISCLWVSEFLFCLWANCWVWRW
jgi:hypothetical protein